MRAAALLAEGASALRAAGIDGAAADARILLAHALGVPRDRLTLALAEDAPMAAITRFRTSIAARAAHQPVAQIIGQRSFWGRDFVVTPDVLDPRPETETLVSAALEQPFGHLLDLGTGSGAIALTLLSERPSATARAVDLSAQALQVARANATALGVADRVQFQQADWFEGVVGPFDLIVSNPPYISQSEFAALAPDVRVFEPRMALVPAGDDDTGLAAYRTICKGAYPQLLPGGWLMVEIGYRQGPAVTALFTACGLQNVSLRHDLSGHPRVVMGQRPVP
jgi:release factor glutamine methyltransferase